MSADDEMLTSELIGFGGRTGVIVGVSRSLTPSEAEDLREQLERRFPGVTFGVIPDCGYATTAVMALLRLSRGTLSMTGSVAALDAGCRCPVVDNNHGQHPPDPDGHWWIVEGCPLHDRRTS